MCVCETIRPHGQLTRSWQSNMSQNHFSLFPHKVFRSRGYLLFAVNAMFENSRNLLCSAQSLHWLPIPQRIQHNSDISVNVSNFTHPPVLSALLLILSASRSRTRLSTVGSRAFSVFGLHGMTFTFLSDRNPLSTPSNQTSRYFFSQNCRLPRQKCFVLLSSSVSSLSLLPVLSSVKLWYSQYTCVGGCLCVSVCVCVCLCVCVLGGGGWGA